MDALLKWITLLGSAAGIVALILRAVDKRRAYLRISLKVKATKNGWATALTTVENKGNLKKYISNAFLLIGPDLESPLDSAKVIAKVINHKGPLQCTNDLDLLRATATTYTEGRALIPLRFYYSENVRIEDEILTYRASIDTRKLNNCVYAVRFFIFGKRRLHRSTHDSFTNVGMAVPSI